MSLVLDIILRGVSNGPTQFESARKIWPLLELLAKITRVLACSCSQIFATARMLGFSLKFSAVQRKHNLHLETKFDAGNSVSRMAKLGNIGETCTSYEDCKCLWKNAFSFC